MRMKPVREASGLLKGAQGSYRARDNNCLASSTQLGLQRRDGRVGAVVPG